MSNFRGIVLDGSVCHGLSPFESFVFESTSNREKEELWNVSEVQKTPFSLFCSYVMRCKNCHSDNTELADDQLYCFECDRLMTVNVI